MKLEKLILLITLPIILTLSSVNVFSSNNFSLIPGISSNISSENEFSLGLELSAVYKINFWEPRGCIVEIPPFVFFGVASEGLYQFSNKDAKWFLGPELGFLLHDYPCLLFGADGGWIKEGNQTGYSIRPFVAFPFFPFLLFYYRYTHFDLKESHEYGLLLKIPLVVFR